MDRRTFLERLATGVGILGLPVSKLLLGSPRRPAGGFRVYYAADPTAPQLTGDMSALARVLDDAIYEGYLTQLNPGIFPEGMGEVTRKVQCPRS